jgi:dihydrofolate synthase/folylpolyglutamate synthase
VNLAGWLEFIERQHPQSIALGLERVREVLARLALPPLPPAITVGGTNGKGSTCAMLEAILGAAGYRVGCYVSPHLLRYNERVRLCGREAGDAALCAGFAAVEGARRGVPLTYFEFGTLAALWLFAREQLDALVLEVGLGGRLDAVNAVDAACAVITSVDIDHVEYLGSTREAIGREKAGILRTGRPVVLADPSPPQSILDEVRRIGAHPLAIGAQFGYTTPSAGQWSYWGPGGNRHGLAYPALRGAIQLANASAAIAALDALREALPVAANDIRRGLAEASLPARFQVLPGRPAVVLDAAHNPQAARVLAQNLSASGYAPRTHAVFGILRDKDAHRVAGALAKDVTDWHLATLSGSRGRSAAELAEVVRQVAPGANIAMYATPAQAFAAARSAAADNDKIVVFGSFLTVAGVLVHLGRAKPPSDA